MSHVNSGAKKPVIPKQQASQQITQAQTAAHSPAYSPEEMGASVLNTTHDQNAFDEAVLDILNDFNFAEHKERKIEDTEPLPLKVVPLASIEKKTAILSSHGVLLGILGPCGLKGHIAHFYNSNLEIEKHIKTEADLSEPFKKAYHYLLDNPQIEIVFVYSTKMIGAFSVDGRLHKIIV